MDGDKYNKEIIYHITMLSKLDNTEETLKAKKKVCILINGQSKNEHNSFKWNRSILPGEPDIVYKRQEIHSSAAIFMMIKYPHLRKDDSFIHTVIKSNLTDACLKIALDVLSSDEDCINFIENSDKIFNSGMDITIVDETNNK